MNIPADYIDVAERIRLFKELYEDGSLQGEMIGVETIGERSFVVYRAEAYRNPSDERPGIGWAWEPVPGPTPFTRDSELMNAETSAWGRAIVALGLPTKKIASSEEVRNRQQTSGTSAADKPISAAEKPIQKGTAKMIGEVVESLQKGFPVPIEGHSYEQDVKTWIKSEFGKDELPELSEAQAQMTVLEFEKRLIRLQSGGAENVPFGEDR